MTDRHRSPAACNYRDISALLPWYVNGSIGEHERQRVDAHLILCTGCREDLAQERRIYQGMTAETAVEYMPAASLKRLQARLDGVVGAASANVGAEVSAARRPGRRSTPWQGWMAA
jgi:anti-sigma factor ChrR (cupin superfamily)